ncbi:MAG TPA: hypothetical protein VJ385_00455 [Fibrobacteria bacterium]|nr:hypothetical protein [Fibrobacteria bacterium]
MKARGSLVACLVPLALGCLQQPVVRPDNAYDARSDIRLPDDSLHLDSVEVWLEDAQDSSRVALLWKGPLRSADSLGITMADADRKLVYVVYGYKASRGQCFVERIQRGGAGTVVVDSCAAPADTGPKPKPKPPHFLADSLTLLNGDSVAVAAVGDAGAYAMGYSTAASWFSASWQSGPVAGLRVRLVAGLPIGYDTASLILTANGIPVDSMIVIRNKHKSTLRGHVVEWNHRAGQAGFTAQLDDGVRQSLTDSTGLFEFPNVPEGPHTISLSAPDRIGAVVKYPSVEWNAIIMVAPASAFQPVDIGWSHPVGAVAAAAGFGIALSTPIDQPGQACVFPLDNPIPSLQRFVPLGNDNGDPASPEYFEAGEVLADSDAIYIAYPKAQRIGRILDWRGMARSTAVSTPFQPGGLLRDGGQLLSLGRLGDGTLALAHYQASTLSLQRIDTLTGFTWDASFPLRHSPGLAAGLDAYYAVDANAPNPIGHPPIGHLMRISKADGKVTAAAEISWGAAYAVAVTGDRVYAGSAASGNGVLVFDEYLDPIGSISCGTVERLAFGNSLGQFQGNGFASASEDAFIIVFAPGVGRDLGTLPLPGGQPARSLALDDRSRSILVSDSSRVFLISF